jgi:hypothetical protein
MPRFKVKLEGGPVFLLWAESGETLPMRFLAIRWVRAASAEEAQERACLMVKEDLAAKGLTNPPDQPLAVRVEQVTELSWRDSLLQRRSATGLALFLDHTN